MLVFQSRELRVVHFGHEGFKPEDFIVLGSMRFGGFCQFARTFLQQSPGGSGFRQPRLQLLLTRCVLLRLTFTCVVVLDTLLRLRTQLEELHVLLFQARLRLRALLLQPLNLLRQQFGVGLETRRLGLGCQNGVLLRPLLVVGLLCLRRRRHFGLQEPLAQVQHFLVELAHALLAERELHLQLRVGLHLLLL